MEKTVGTPKLSSLLVKIQPNGTHPPFFCIHPVGGEILAYFDLVKALGNDYPFYAIRARGFDQNEPFHLHLNDMVKDYINAIRSIQPKGPYYLGGWSAGGIIISEIAYQLQQQGETINLLVVMDSPHLEKENPLIQTNPIKIFVDIFNIENNAKLKLDPHEIDNMSFEDQLNYVFKKAKDLGVIPLFIEFSDFKRRLDVFQNIVKAINEFVSRPYNNVKQICLIDAKKGVLETLGYSDKGSPFLKPQTSGAIEHHLLDCNHWEMMKPPHIDFIAKILKKYLQ